MYEKYNENQVFIGIPFDESMENILEVIQEACKENRLDPKVVNQGIGANSIIDEIKNLIEESEFLIIDLSLENPNVYYEFRVCGWCRERRIRYINPSKRRYQFKI